MEKTIYSQYRPFNIGNIWFSKLFDSYSATFGPISMKFGTLVWNVMAHMLTNFREVLSIHLGLIGYLVYFATPLL